MIAVIFEVEPHAGQTSAYLDAAASLRSSLERQDGFISIERFESLTTPASCCRYRSGATRLRSRDGATTKRIAPCRTPDGGRSSLAIDCASRTSYATMARTIARRCRRTRSECMMAG